MTTLLIPLLLLAPLQDWPHWRGPRANGSIDAEGYPAAWTAPDWKVRLPGKGGSTPLVLGERIFLSSPAEGQDAVLAFDLEGKPVWTTKLGPWSPAKHKALGSSCNASPATDGEALYVYFRSGRLAALGLDGRVRWTTDIVERFGPEQLFWDQGSSPVTAGGLLILPRMHGGESWIAAFDKATGGLKWKRPRTLQVPKENDNGYTTPLLVPHGDRQALLIWGADLLSAYDAADGSPIWSCGGFNPEGTGYWPAIATPVVSGDVVVVPVGRDDRGQARLHGIRLGGSGDVTATHRVWTRDDLGVFVPSPVEYRGRIHLLRHRGDVVCLDPADGKTLWTATLPRSKGSYYASPVIAGGLLYAAREDGTVFSGRVGEGFELLGEHAFGERIVASPVPARKRLFLRGDEHLFCVGGGSK
jgi:outer membrane protein assembly factor BamB